MRRRSLRFPSRRRVRRRRREPVWPWWLALVLLLAAVGWYGWRWTRTPRSALPDKQTTTPARPPPTPTSATNAPLPPAQPATSAPPVAARVATPVRDVPPVSPAAAAAESYPRPARNVLEAQIALARRGISPGSIDGVLGSQTRAAIVAFQQREGLPETGALDSDTLWALTLNSPPLTTHVVSAEDLARLQPLSDTWLGKSQQSALEYETILELLAEKGRAAPGLIRQLNPAVDWTNVTVGTEVRLPDAAAPEPVGKGAFAVITLGAKRLQVFDSATNLLAHFPCSIAARVEKRPLGELRVTAIAENPNYTFDPEVFPESPEARELGRKLILPPGPNNPVGVAWVSLDRPGYGIHGTPHPEQVGRTESHGCFRLANWNASHFVKLAWVGMPVYVQP